VGQCKLYRRSPSFSSPLTPPPHYRSLKQVITWFNSWIFKWLQITQCGLLQSGNHFSPTSIDGNVSCTTHYQYCATGELPYRLQPRDAAPSASLLCGAFTAIANQHKACVVWGAAPGLALSQSRITSSPPPSCGKKHLHWILEQRGEGNHCGIKDYRMSPERQRRSQHTRKNSRIIDRSRSVVNASSR
jgi:hypothetical protein